MKKINLLAGETSSGSSSTTISNLGLIQLKPLLDIEPKNEVQELYPGDDGVSGYSFIRIKGVNNQDDKFIDPSVNEQVVTPDAGFLGMKQVTVNGVTNTIDKNITPENIKKGVTILGVEGVCESTNNQEKTIAKSDLINNTNKSVTGELVHDSDFTGMSKITYTKVNLNNNFTVEFRTPSDDKFAGLNLNVPLAGFDGVSKFSYKTRRQDKTVTPSTTEQTINCDSGYVGIRSVTVNPVTSSIDVNITPENIVKGVSILGVEGIAEKPANPSDQWDYDLLIHTTDNKAASFPQIVDEDGKQYLIFCNGNIDLASCLYGFSYRTSNVRFSYHRYSAALFKKIGDFIYVDATTLGGVSNSDGIYVTYDFNDHNIPEKFYFNCGNGNVVSVGTSCRKCGVDAFNFDNNDYVITRAFFEYNVNYNPNNLKKTTIDNIINKDQVRTIKICNEDNVINNNYPMYSDVDGMKYGDTDFSEFRPDWKYAPRSKDNVARLFNDHLNLNILPRIEIKDYDSLPEGSVNFDSMYAGKQWRGSGKDASELNDEHMFEKASNLNSLFARCSFTKLPIDTMYIGTCDQASRFCDDGRLEEFPTFVTRASSFAGDFSYNAMSIKKINRIINYSGENVPIRELAYEWNHFRNVEYWAELDFSLIKDTFTCSSPKSTFFGGFVGMKKTMNFSVCTQITAESMNNIITKAGTADSGSKIIFGETNLAKLSEAEKQVAIDKGWTLE